MRHIVLVFTSSFVVLSALLLPVRGATVTNQKRPEDARLSDQYQADCAAGVSLSSCGTIPVSKDCEAGRHWTLAGLNYAHCVLDDMSCALGTRLAHDALGNPSCIPIVCPPGQILVNDHCGPEAPPPPVVQLPVPGFDGMAYGGYTYPGNALAALNIPAGAGYAKMNMILNTGNGSWQFSATAPIHPNGCCQPVTAPSSGIWTMTPNASYQYRIRALEYGRFNPSFPVGRPYNINDTRNYWTGVTPFPAAPTEWTTLPAGSLVAIAGINMDLVNGCTYVSAANFPFNLKFTLQLRKAAEPDLVTTAAFDLVLHFSDMSSCNGSSG